MSLYDDFMLVIFPLCLTLMPPEILIFITRSFLALKEENGNKIVFINLISHSFIYSFKYGIIRSKVHGY